MDPSEIKVRFENRSPHHEPLAYVLTSLGHLEADDFED